MTKEQMELEIKIRKLRAQMAEDTRAMRSTIVRSALADHRFPSQQARRDAHAWLLARLETNESNDFTINGIELDEFIETQVKTKPMWREQPAPQAESTPPPQSAKQPEVVTDFDIDDLNENSTPDQLERARLAIISVLPKRNERRY